MPEEPLQHHRRIGELESELLKALRRIAELESEKIYLEKAAHEDQLTTVYNRRGFNKRLEAIKAVVDRQPDRFTYPDLYYLSTDIDYFKKINDTHGHSAGDLVLQQFASILTGDIRDYDIVGRFGGEEFLIALVDISPDEAYAKANALAEDVRTHPFEMPGKVTIKVTASFGLAGDIEAADKALYQAKQAGRDRVVVAS